MKIENLQDSGKYFHLFADCIPVKGYKRSVICDVTREEVFYIPNALLEIVKLFEHMKIKDIFDLYQGQESILFSYFTFLTDNELGELTEDISLFPPIEKTWDSPSEITNSIIDADTLSKEDFKSTVDQLEELLCQSLQIRFYEVVGKKRLEDLLSCTSGSLLINIELILPYNELISQQDYIEISKQHQRISTIYITNSPDSYITSHNQFVRNIDMGMVIYTSQKIDSCKACGLVNQKSFSAFALNDFFHNVSYNSCLNRKISIDKQGDIKNCPSMKESFGNIKSTKLKAALEKSSFKKYWNVNKDQVDTCKDCEFRYICTDCRAYVDNPQDMYSKPLKCGYNPYNNQWEEWSTNNLKEKAIAYYDLEVLKTV